MSMDWLKDLIDEDASNGEKPGLAEVDPSGWLLKQIEDDENHCFVQAGENHFNAVAQRKTALVQVNVKLDDEGFVSITANAGIYASPETEIPFRIFQMAENATFKTMGYTPAQAGELITFNVCIRPNDDLELSTLIEHCIHSVADQAPAFERIRAGETPGAVHEDVRGEHIRHALRLRQLLG